MPWGAAAAAAVVGGSIIQGNKAAGAANAAAQAQREVGQQSAEYQKFRPVGITTGFGSSEFTEGPYGVESAKYTLTPEMKALRDKRIAEATAYDPTQLGQYAQPLYGAGSSLFNLGGDYLGANPQEVAAKYISDRQGLLAPSRAAEFGRLQARNFATGRGGLGVQTGTGTAPSNPALQAYYNSIFQQDKMLAAEADQAAMDRIRFGADLYSAGGGLLSNIPKLTTAGYGPLQTQLGLASSIENLGQEALTLGLDVGGRNAAAGARAGQSLLESGIRASQTQQAANSWSPFGTALQGLGSSYMGGMSGGGAGANPFNRYGSGLFDWGRAPTSSSGFESWESPYIQR
jgi:hypothetical protein